MGKLTATKKAISEAVDKALDMSREARMARAREMGFDTSRTVYHGTPDGRGIDGGLKTRDQKGYDAGILMADERPNGAYFFADDRAVASSYADDMRAFDYQNAEPEVIEAHLRMANPMEIDWGGKPWHGTEQAIEDARASGHDGLIIRNVIDNYQGTGKPTTVRVVLDPSQVRRTSAAFDPAKSDSPNLLAGGAAAAVGLGAATQGEDAEAGVITRGGKKLLEFWHGSPHQFDKFDMSKIGTGEGAQAYGHGLYGADSQDVAQQYKEGLTNKAPPDGSSHLDKVAFNVVRRAPDAPAEELAPYIRNVYPDLPDSEVVGAVERARSSLQPGALYRVEADIDPDMLLDWDKPLSEQSDAARDVLSPYLADDLMADPEGAVRAFLDTDYAKQFPSLHDVKTARQALDSSDDWMDAGEWVQKQMSDRGSSLYNLIGGNEASHAYERMSRALGGPDAASAALREAGIPGIRYLDGNSRTAGEGSYNYVMFDDKPLRIMERGNINPTLLASMGGASALTVAANEFQQRRQEKRSQWDALRQDLLGAMDQAVQAIEMPWRGYLGLSRMAGGLVAGEGFDQALAQGAQQARQPVEQTAYDLGGQVTDATGSPALGTAINVGVNMGGPI